MNVLEKINLAGGVCLCAEIGRFDGSLWDQYWSKRAAIWTVKYPEARDEDGLERDAYDESSSVIVLLSGTSYASQVIAGCRLIHAEDISQLPVGSCASFPDKGRAVEVSRFYFTPDAEGTKFEADQQFGCFVSGITQFLHNQGYQRAYATVREPLFHKLSERGVPIARIGENQRHAAKVFVPAVMFEAKEEVTLPLASLGKTPIFPLREAA